MFWELVVASDGPSRAIACGRAAFRCEGWLDRPAALRAFAVSGSGVVISLRWLVAATRLLGPAHLLDDRDDHAHRLALGELLADRLFLRGRQRSKLRENSLKSVLCGDERLQLIAYGVDRAEGPGDLDRQRAQLRRQRRSMSSMPLGMGSGVSWRAIVSRARNRSAISPTAAGRPKSIPRLGGPAAAPDRGKLGRPRWPS